MPVDPLQQQLQGLLGVAHTLGRELGGGGMSRVFMARDESLGRDIVVKVLTPELAEGLSAERFAREVRLAARLQHPNIVPVLAAGERDGLAYYTMPYVEGESLRARLSREGRLSTDAAISILRDVARALEYAHAHGVVHRDVKPDNILLAGSAATVADFGIAKAIDVARTIGSTDATDQETLTRVGTALGTPMYMAPEQAAGDPLVGAAADIYAWGVVAFELLAGAPPFTGRAAHQLIAAHIREEPPSLAQRAPDVPAAIASLVMRCLEKDPARRPQSAGELLAALDAARTPSGAEVVSTPWMRSRRTYLAVGLLAASLLATVGWLASHRAPPQQVTASRPILVVLPFENLGAPGDAYFADGLTDEVRGRLTRISGLQVIGGASARQYRGTTKSPREIARELGATYLLTGSVRWDRTIGNGRVRVSPELLRASDQASVWAEPIEGPLDDVFAMQSRVAERVAVALDVALLAPERGTVAARPTASLAAYDAYLRGLAGITIANRFSVASRRTTEAEFERAIALDSTFAAAYARLARLYLEDESQAGDSRAAVAAHAKAAAAAGRAWALDTTLVEVRLARAALLRRTGDRTAADVLVRETARIAPGDIDVLSALADAEFAAGSYDSAIATYRRAVALDPRVASLWGGLAGSFQSLYRFPEAIEAHEREIALAPNADITYAVQAAAYLLWRADTSAARRTLERAGPSPQWLVRFPGGIAGGTIWAHALPQSLLYSRDTLTLAGYLAGAGGIAPELYHLLKLRHYQMLGLTARARAHADSLVPLLAQPLQREGEQVWFFGWFSRRIALAEALAMQGHGEEAGGLTDRYVEAARQQKADGFCNVLHNAAFVDAQVGRVNVAVARLAEALRQPCGMRLSRALLRADPSWASLRGDSSFEQLLAGRE